MDIDDKIKNCELYLNQIKHYDPDPYYIEYFFGKFIDEVNQIINGIFEEGNRDFGLFIKDKISQKEFELAADKKNDQKAKEFSIWFTQKFEIEHKKEYPEFIKMICKIKQNTEKIPEIKIMIRPKNRYKDDIYQQIDVNLSKGKIRSKEELQIQIKRQLPVFLEIINNKRKLKNEPKVKENEIVASAFTNVNGGKDFEIFYSVQVYIPVIKRLVDDSRQKIIQLSTWNN